MLWVLSPIVAVLVVSESVMVNPETMLLTRKVLPVEDAPVAFSTVAARVSEPSGGVKTGAWLTAVTVTLTVSVAVPPRPSATLMTKLSLVVWPGVGV